MEHKSIIYKANLLTRASFKLTLNEQRLILACIAQIKDPREPISRDDEFVVTAPYFSRLFRIHPKTAYAELSEAARLLANREVIIDHPDPDNPKKSRTITGWADFVDYYDGEGKVIIRFREKMIPYLSNLKDGGFTKYRIEMIAKIKSVYAIRFYEILLSEAWKKKDYELNIEDLRVMFQLNNEYERIFDFKKYVVDPSINSINKHTDISVSYSQKKSGRSVTHFIFSYSIIESKEVKLTKEYIQKNALPGESWSDARARLLAKLK
jgi:plasmid replication initiation protein